MIRTLSCHCGDIDGIDPHTRYEGLTDIPGGDVPPLPTTADARTI